MDLPQIVAQQNPATSIPTPPMALWILAKRLEMPELQNDAIDMLEMRRRMEGMVQEKTLGYVYSNTGKGDKLRLYLVDACCRSGGVVKERFPVEMMGEVEEVQGVKVEEDDGVEERFEMEMEMEVEMGKYHVPVSEI